MGYCLPLIQEPYAPGKVLFMYLNKKKAFFFLFFFYFLSTSVFAQKTISGTITAGDAVEAGITVHVKGTNQATLTDEKGRFTITAPANATLIISNVGYTSQEIKVGNQSSFTIQLQPSNQQLEQVVVVGYGTQKKATVTGAISAIKGEEILKSPVTNVSNGLVGRLPGLMATTPSSEPGADGAVLRIRGVNTFSSKPSNDAGSDPNNALVVVDGVPGRSLDRIDPNSIESITVLKDASAAIYGSRAANGVILVTTKRGKTGKPTIAINLNNGYSQPTRLPKMADAATYTAMLNEIALYAGRSPLYTEDDIQKYKDGSEPWTHPNTDWFKETLRPWSAQNAANATISGGSEFLKYFVSVGAKKQDGNYYESATSFKQYDFRSNLDGKINDYISIGFDLAGRMEDMNYPTRSAGDIFRMVQRGKPNLPAYWPDGTPGPDIEYGNNPVVISTNATGYDRNKVYVLNSNSKLNIKIPGIKGLSLTGNAAIDKTFGFRKVWQTPWYLYSWDYQTRDANGSPVLIKGKRGFDDPRLTEYMRDEQLITLNALLNYETSFAGDHNVKFLVGTEKIKGSGDNFNAFRRYFPSSSLDQLFAGGTTDMNNGGSAFVNSRLNYFGRVNYNYKEKYLGEFVWRYDGSYIFNPADKPFGFFPGVSAGWRVSEEAFWKDNLSFINNFKLRASWGRTGNDRIGEWNYLTTYSLGNFMGSPFAPFVVNGAEAPTLYEPRTPNPAASWEVANQSDVGFDASFLNSKLTVEADYFYYKRTGILIQRRVSIPTTTGMTLPAENIGKSQNQGFDFNINYRDQAGKLNYQIGINGGYSKSKVLFWDEAPEMPDYQKRTGRPIPTNPDPNANLYYVATGVYHDQDEIDKSVHRSDARPGDVIFKDVNDDGKIDGNDRVRNYKTNVPTFVGGFSLGLQLKQFDLSVLLQGATGAVNYISTESGEIGNYLASFANGRWTPDNTNADAPRTFNRSNEYWVGNANTYWLRKTNYLRLKNLQLGLYLTF